MLPTNIYPYLDITDLNLDMILKSIKTLAEKLNNFVALNTIKYANPIQWNITTQYEMNTVVIDPVSGTAYLSVAPVPSGVSLTNTDYWTPIFTLNLLSANQNITLRDDANNVIATFTSNEGDWLIWNYTLYRVTRHIDLSQAYVVGYNLERYTVELFVKDYINAINNIIGNMEDLTTEDKDTIVNAINELNGNIGNLSTLTTSDKDSLVDAINELDAEIADIDFPYIRPEDYGAVGDGVTDDRIAIQNMIDAADSNTVCFFSSSDGYYISDYIEIRNKKNLIFYNGKFILNIHPTPHWFDIYDSDGITFKNCEFTNSAQIIRLFTCENITIEGCTFISTGYTIIQETGYISNNVIVNNNRFYESENTPIECNCGVGYTSKNWIITNNICVNDYNDSGLAEHCFVTITCVDNVVIANNIAENFRGDGIIQLERISENIVIDGNVFKNCAGFAFIDIQHQGKSTIISNNKCVQEYTSATPFLYMGLASDNMNVKSVITGNHFIGNGTAALLAISNGSPTSPKTYSPIILSNNLFENFTSIFKLDMLTELIKASDNVFNAPSVCFDFSASSTYPGRNLKNCEFNNNRFIGSVTFDQNYYGARSSKIVFAGNEIHGNVDIKRVDDMLFSNNVLYDDSTYSFSAGNHTVAQGNYKFGVGTI